MLPGWGLFVRFAASLKQYCSPEGVLSDLILVATRCSMAYGLRGQIHAVLPDSGFFFRVTQHSRAGLYTYRRFETHSPYARTLTLSPGFRPGARYPILSMSSSD